MRNDPRAATMTLLTLAMLAFAAPLQAQDDWRVEMTPYLWIVGTDADVTVDAQTVRVKRDFEHVDLGGSVLGVAQLNRLVGWAQLDFLALDTNELERAPAPGRLRTDVFLATLGFGYQVAQAGASTIDVLLGVRHLGLDGKLTVNSGGRFRQKENFTDAVMIVRLSWRLGKDWYFNPAMSIGRGESESNWELQPQLQYRITEEISLRFGYRHLYYKLDARDGDRAWDGAFQGMVFGISGVFGG